MNYTQAQIDRANAVSLEDFLRTQGETLIKSGREYRWKEHDSLTVRGNKWFRHSQSKGGYPSEAAFQHTLPQRVHDLLQLRFEHRAVQFLRAAGPPCMPELVAAASEVHADMSNGTQPLIFFGVRGIK